MEAGEEEQHPQRSRDADDGHREDDGDDDGDGHSEDGGQGEGEFEIKDFSNASMLERLSSRLATLIPIVLGDKNTVHDLEFDGKSFSLEYCCLEGCSGFECTPLVYGDPREDAVFDTHGEFSLRILGLLHALIFRIDENRIDGQYGSVSVLCNSIRSALLVALHHDVRHSHGRNVAKGRVVGCHAAVPVLVLVGQAFGLGFDPTTRLDFCIHIKPRNLNLQTFPKPGLSRRRTETSVSLSRLLSVYPSMDAASRPAKQGQPGQQHMPWVHVLEEYLGADGLFGTYTDPVSAFVFGVETENDTPKHYDMRVVLQPCDFGISAQIQRFVDFLALCERIETAHAPSAASDIGVKDRSASSSSASSPSASSPSAAASSYLDFAAGLFELDVSALREAKEAIESVFSASSATLENSAKTENDEAREKDQFLLLDTTSRRLLVRVAECETIGQFRAFWLEFVRRLRWFWESGTPIPGVAVPLDHAAEDRGSALKSPTTPTSPTFSLRRGVREGLVRNAVERKIQLLQYCIVQQSMNPPSATQNTAAAAHSEVPVVEGWEMDIVMDDAPSQQSQQQPAGLAKVVTDRPPEPTHSSQTNTERGGAKERDGDEDEDEDEFFDAHEAEESAVPQIASPVLIPDDPYRARREGALHPLLRRNKPFYSFAVPDMPLYVPETLKPPPDFVLLDVHGVQDLSGVRILKSDMSSFKAANPGCDMRDFLRWHSPKDIRDDGSYSERFQKTSHTGDSMWENAWDHSLPKPASEQPPLLNLVREAELVLNELEVMSLREVLVTILPIASALGIHLALKSRVCESFHVEKHLLDIGQRSVHAWEASETADEFAASGLVHGIQSAEYAAAAVASLLSKFSHCTRDLADIDRILDYSFRDPAQRIPVSEHHLEGWHVSETPPTSVEHLLVWEKPFRRLYIGADLFAQSCSPFLPKP
eukprot:ANDGO_02208.mRNA.1 Rab3 GTPase-activating protein catalytic subunit